MTEYSRTDMMECSRADMMECSRADMMECYRAETMECCRADMMECCRADMMKYSREDMTEYSRTDMMECSREDTIECSRADIMECSRVGMMKNSRAEMMCSRADMMECCRVDMTECSRADMTEYSRADMMECSRADMIECLRADMMECSRADMTEYSRTDMMECSRADMMNQYWFFGAPGPGAAGPIAAGPGSAGPDAAGPDQVITGTGRVPGDKVTTAAALSEKCYQYTGLTAINTCCKMLDYAENNGSNILQCANTSTHTQYFTKQRNKQSAASRIQPRWRRTHPATEATIEETAEEENMGGRGQHWVMLGDSHIRNVFELLVKRIISPRVKYRLTSFKKNVWKDIELIYEKPWKYHNETIDVVHLDLPLRLTFHWDPFHHLLADLLHQWLAPPHLLHPPSLLLISDSVLHWVKEIVKTGINRGLIETVKDHQLLGLLKHLKSLSRYTRVVFKYQDYIPANKLVFLSDENMDVYNSFSRFCLVGSEVAVWDSTVPLSSAYSQHCRKYNKISPDRTWRCDDGGHVGYIIIEKYVDMLMNYVCNRFLNLSDDYCIT
ncbi:uncharacterized protein [Cherax quadricarinatus]|uniref:uncharacterized protein n=1 Tax=Cherax quadricarinatus TaxID=27406 RepID=UPI00387E9BDC